MDEPIRLNLGAGDCPLPGYVNVDKRDIRGVCPSLGAVIQDRGEAFPLPYRDDVVDEIRASHILEHFPYGQVMDVLRDWVRVLKPGGVLKIAVPDFQKISRWYEEGREFNLLGYLFGGQTDEYDFHKVAFDEALLTQMMEACGLVYVERWESEIEDCASLPVSLNLMGIKIGVEVGLNSSNAALRDEPQEISVDLSEIGANVQAIMSVPRLGFQDNFFCVWRALLPLGIRLRTRGGVFWGQRITVMMEEAIEEVHPRYILTLDYDTVFTQSDVEQLYAIMEAREEIDALCALQMRRSSDTGPLFTLTDLPGASHETVVPMDAFDAETMPIRTGHFGLTLIRVSGLEKLPKPWICARPGADGRWGSDRTDEDISFWLNWRDSGLSLHLASHVVVGHLELQVMWPDARMKPLFQNTQFYIESGKPVGVWR